MQLDDVHLRATLTQRYNFAGQHMMVAARFCRLCYQVEQKNIDQPFGPFFDEILSYVSATVLSSVAALEANINETFSDVQDGIIKISDFDVQTLKDSWSDIERLGILEKYEQFLKLKGKGRLDKSDSQYQFAKILISVRNALIHYKPEWDAEQREHEKIGKRLKGKFQFSPFVDEKAPIFPMRCMTYSFADWAVQTGLNFVEWFSDLVVIPNRFEKFVDRLKTSPE